MSPTRLSRPSAMTNEAAGRREQRSRTARGRATGSATARRASAARAGARQPRPSRSAVVAAAVVEGDGGKRRRALTHELPSGLTQTAADRPDFGRRGNTSRSGVATLDARLRLESGWLAGCFGGNRSSHVGEVRVTSSGLRRFTETVGDGDPRRPTRSFASKAPTPAAV